MKNLVQDLDFWSSLEKVTLIFFISFISLDSMLEQEGFTSSECLYLTSQLILVLFACVLLWLDQTWLYLTTNIIEGKKYLLYSTSMKNKFYNNQPTFSRVTTSLIFFHIFLFRIHGQIIFAQFCKYHLGVSQLKFAQNSVFQGKGVVGPFGWNWGVSIGRYSFWCSINGIGLLRKKVRECQFFF